MSVDAVAAGATPPAVSAAAPTTGPATTATAGCAPSSVHRTGDDRDSGWLRTSVHGIGDHRDGWLRTVNHSTGDHRDGWLLTSEFCMMYLSSTCFIAKNVHPTPTPTSLHCSFVNDILLLD
ncbi:hypothetical protein PLESTF_001641800 [Pleodorina starrii]|nr:hypothetical protein PLESTF_001641800 [Pleodorina starrii]